MVRTADESVLDGNLELHTIPVAQAAIALIVHLPTGCTISSADNASSRDRFDMLSANLEKAFLNGAGAPTWSTLLPNSPSCTGPITRVVRYDETSMTFQVMNYLSEIASALGDSTDAANWITDSEASSQSESWPNNASHIVYGGTTSTHGSPSVCTLFGPGNTPPAAGAETATQTVDCNGAVNVAGAVLDTPGSIGYVDLNTADTAYSEAFAYPSKGTGSTFWVPVQNNGVGTKGATFADPQVNNNGYISGNALGGANCASSSYTPPSDNGGDPTLVSWDQVTGTSPDQADYPACMLTYALAWQDSTDWEGNTSQGDARARNVKDYLLYQLWDTYSTDGQDILPSLGYGSLPSNLETVSQNAVNGITWSGSN